NNITLIIPSIIPMGICGIKALIIIAIPVAPPTARSEGIRKKYRPQVIINNPRFINRNLLKSNLIFNLSLPLFVFVLTHYIILSKKLQGNFLEYKYLKSSK